MGPSQYALYRGDDFICLGTIREISEYTGLNEHTIRFYGSNTYKKRRKNGGINAKILIKIEED